MSGTAGIVLHTSEPRGWKTSEITKNCITHGHRLKLALRCGCYDIPANHRSDSKRGDEHPWDLLRRGKHWDFPVFESYWEYKGREELGVILSSLTEEALVWNKDSFPFLCASAVPQHHLWTLLFFLSTFQKCPCVCMVLVMDSRSVVSSFATGY